MPADTLSHDHLGQSGPMSGLRCDAVDPRSDDLTWLHPVSRDDAAIVIGLALAHARKGWGGAATVPDAILDRLTALADQGEPTCRMVRAWLAWQVAEATHPAHRSLAMPLTMPITTRAAEILSSKLAAGEER